MLGPRLMSRKGFPTSLDILQPTISPLPVTPGVGPCCFREDLRGRGGEGERPGRPGESGLRPAEVGSVCGGDTALAGALVRLGRSVFTWAC